MCGPIAETRCGEQSAAGVAFSIPVPFGDDTQRFCQHLSIDTEWQQQTNMNHNNNNQTNNIKTGTTY